MINTVLFFSREFSRDRKARPTCYKILWKKHISLILLWNYFRSSLTVVWQKIRSVNVVIYSGENASNFLFKKWLNGSRGAITYLFLSLCLTFCFDPRHHVIRTESWNWFEMAFTTVQNASKSGSRKFQRDEITGLVRTSDNLLHLLASGAKLVIHHLGSPTCQIQVQITTLTETKKHLPGSASKILQKCKKLRDYPNVTHILISQYCSPKKKSFHFVTHFQYSEFMAPEGSPC